MTTVTTRPTLDSVLSALSRERLYDLGRVMGAGLRETKAPKSELVRGLSAVLGKARLPAVLRELGREELRTVLRSHDIEDDSPRRERLIETLLTLAGYDPKASVPPPPRVSRHLTPWGPRICGFRSSSNGSPPKASPR